MLYYMPDLLGILIQHNELDTYWPMKGWENRVFFMTQLADIILGPGGNFRRDSIYESWCKDEGSKGGSFLFQ